MSRSFPFILVIILGWLTGWIAPTFALEPSTSSSNHVAVELHDRSLIIGEMDLESITLATEFTGIVQVPIAKVAVIQIGSTNGTSLLMLRNGDRLKGAVQTGSLKLDTLFGKVTIPVALVSKISVSTSGNMPAVLTDGLLLYYSFDTDDGETVKDLSGHGHDGQVFGAKYVADGVSGGAYEFNGDGDYIRVPTAPELRSPKFSISVWAKSHAAPNRQIQNQRQHFRVPMNGNYGPFGIIGAHRAGDNRNYFVLRMRSGQLGTEMIGNTSGQGFDLSHEGDSFLNQWGMVTLTYDGAVESLYFNGKPVERHDVDDYRGSKYDFLIGAMEFQSSGDSPQLFWRGLLDEVRIYNRALSEDEIQTLYDSVNLPKNDR